MLAATLLGAASSLLVPPGVSLPSRPVRPSSRPQRAPAPTCCICINCKLVDRCKLYHWVEEMHEQPHLTEEADFDPADPQVQVFLRSEEDAGNIADGRPLLTTEYDVFACDAFVPDEGRWLRLMPDAQYVPT